MVLGVHLVNNLHQNAVLVEDEGLAEGAHIFAAIEGFFAPGSEGLDHLS